MNKGIIVAIIVAIAIGIGVSIGMSYDGGLDNEVNSDQTTGTNEPNEEEGKSYTVELDESLSIKTP